MVLPDGQTGELSSVIVPAEGGGPGLQAECTPGSPSHMDCSSLISSQQTENKPWLSP